jgi:pimeloyl-ACP methyl ester carboxylesterase
MKTLPYDTSGRTRGGVSFVGTRVRSGASGIETLGSTTRSAATAAARSRLRDFEEASALPSPGQIPADVPVTIVWGTKGRLLRPPQVLEARAQLPQARIRPLPGCGHVPITDDPALVADVMLQGSSRLVGQPVQR